MTGTSLSQMHGVIERLNRLGITVRFDFLDGCGGGLHQVGDRRWLLIDRGITAQEQITCMDAAAEGFARTHRRAA